MTSSDRPAAPPAWTVDPLLSRGRKKQTPAFVRLAWDEASAQDFGPWRISPKPDPAETQSTPATVIHEPSTPPLPPEPEQAAEKPGAANCDRQRRPKQSPDKSQRSIRNAYKHWKKRHTRGAFKMVGNKSKPQLRRSVRRRWN